MAVPADRSLAGGGAKGGFGIAFGGIGKTWAQLDGVRLFDVAAATTGRGSRTLGGGGGRHTGKTPDRKQTTRYTI